MLDAGQRRGDSHADVDVVLDRSSSSVGPTPRDTRVGLVADCSMTGPMRLFGPVIRYAIRRADGGQLAAFAATFTTAPHG